MLEQLIKDLIAALNANTAAQGGKAPAADAGSTGSADTSTTKAAGKGKTTAKTGPTREEMAAALTEVKDTLGAAEAKSIISGLGVTKMVDIPDEKIAAAFKLAKSKLEAAAAAAAGGEDGDDI